MSDYYYYYTYDDDDISEGDQNFTGNNSFGGYENTAASVYHEYETAYRRFQTLLVVLVLPVCLLGLVANTVSVWVWNANKRYNTMVLLFQFLGMADNLFLLLSALHAVLDWHHLWMGHAEAFVFPLLYLAQSLSAHSTMTIGVFRWLAVARPKQGTMRKRHVVGTCGAVAAWCLLLTALVIIRENALDGTSELHIWLVGLSQMLGFVLPTLLLLFFSLALLTITWRHRRMQSKHKHLKTTTAVLSIAFSSFLACPVAVTAHLVAVVSTHHSTRHISTGCCWPCVFDALGAGNVLQVLNSSINFLFYFFFASRFRPLLRQKLSGFCAKIQRRPSLHRKASAVSSTNATSDSFDGGSPHGSAQASALHTRETTPVPAEVDPLSSAPGEEDKLPASADTPPPTEATNFM